MFILPVPSILRPPGGVNVPPGLVTTGFMETELP